MLHKIEQDVRFQMDLKHEVKRQQSRHKRNFSKESSAENNNFSGHLEKTLSDWLRFPWSRYFGLGIWTWTGPSGTDCPESMQNFLVNSTG